MADNRCFVQFPHPGGEHRPDGNGKIGWNKVYRDSGKENPHKRKFMQFHGEWAEEDGTTRPDNLWAWGEWEPESDLVCELDIPEDDSQGPYPHYLWDPYYIVPPEENYRDLHNTDPFIFGDHILYSNCGQTAPSKSALRTLARGSVIAFGSGKKIGGKKAWVLDTVLVIKDSIPYDPLNPRKALACKVPEVFLEVTGRPLAADPKLAKKPVEGGLRLYRGATPKDPVDGMFSFFPAKPAGGDTGFPRPCIDLPNEHFKPSNWQAPKGATCDLPCEKRRGLWEKLVKKVREAELVLGTHAELPPRPRA